MAGQDAEIEQLRASVNCAAVLERLPPAWRLDKQASTQNCLKYRRGAGEILIVNHQGRGWWDPQSDRKGDCFSLVQFLEPGLNFGQVRKVLRPFAGISPDNPEAARPAHRTTAKGPPGTRWEQHTRLRKGSRTWRYLADERGLPTSVLLKATASDVIREGPGASAWFAHRTETDAVVHVEIRGPRFKGSLTGGTKVLFRLRGGDGPLRRLALTEAPIDALSLAACESSRADTLYAATGGGMGPETLRAIEGILARLAAHPDAELAGATDANRAGDRYAAKHAAMAQAVGVAFVRLRPEAADGDWNDVLKARRRAQ